MSEESHQPMFYAGFTDEEVRSYACTGFKRDVIPAGTYEAEVDGDREILEIKTPLEVLSQQRGKVVVLMRRHSFPNVLHMVGKAPDEPSTEELNLIKGAESREHAASAILGSIAFHTRF